MEQSLFLAFAQIIKQEFGIQLPQEKKALLESRMQRLLKAGYADAGEFLKALQADRTGNLLRELSEAITTHHTYFMRETDHFDCFRDTVIPWLQQSVTDGDIRTWCAACSTGQEAYTLAMLLQDGFGLQGNRWDKTLLATDLSREVLSFAKEGVYQVSAMQDLPVNWQNSYFHTKDASHRQVIDIIRNQILFRPFNLMTPQFPFKKPFHVIFCRNVMIYFDMPTRQRLVRQFYDYLVPGGYLFVGHSETVERQAAPFRYVMPSVYRKPLEAESAVRELTQKEEKRPLVSIPRNREIETEAPHGAVRLIALGASTGGTEALAQVIGALRPPLPPIVIVQHIPEGFSNMFAQRLNRDSAFTVTEAVNGDILEPNHIYVAAGNVQMKVRKTDEMLRLVCQGTEKVNGHCPSVDVLFHSVAKAVGKQAVGAIFTGMGNDGAKGLLAMRQAGAHTLGQDKTTSVVYGMPRAAYELGAVERQLPLLAMPGKLMELARGEMRG